MTHARRLVDSLFVPLYAAIVFVVLFAAISLASSLSSWSGGYNPALPLSLGWLAREVPLAMSRALFGSVVATTFFLVYRIRKHPGYRLLSFLLALASAAALLSLATEGLDRLFPARTTATTRIEPFVAQRFEILGDNALFVERVDGNALSGVTFVQPSRDPVLSFAPAARFSPRSMRITAPEVSMPVPLADPIYGPLFQPPPFLGAFFSDVGAVSSEVDQAFATSRTALAIVAGAILLFCMSCTMVSRLTTWPLLNGFLTLLVYRGLFFVFPLLRTSPARPIVRQIGSALGLGPWGDYLPSFALSLLALVFLLIDFTLLRGRGTGAAEP